MYNGASNVPSPITHFRDRGTVGSNLFADRIVGVQPHVDRRGAEGD
jgi:hypothetical protein